MVARHCYSSPTTSFSSARPPRSASASASRRQPASPRPIYLSRRHTPTPDRLPWTTPVWRTIHLSLMVDSHYLQLFEDGIVAAGTEAVRRGRPAEVGLAMADGAGVGTNRRDPTGPADPQVPVLLVKSVGNGDPIACMIVCSMHPTVLREASKVVSGDFPGMARRFLQEPSAGAGLSRAASHWSCGQPEPAPRDPREHPGGSSTAGRDARPRRRRCDRKDHL